jgi:hypothetical protein
MTEKSLPQPASPNANKTKGRRTFTPYVLVWAALAAISLVYLGLLATQPTMVAGVLSANQQKTAESDTLAIQQRAIGEAVAEVRTLRDTLDQFRNELIEIRAQVTNQGDATREISNRVATLETDPAELQRLAKDATAKSAAQAKAAKTAEAATQKAEAAQKLAADKAAAEAKKTAKSAPGIETGSVAQPAAGAAIMFGPPTVTPTPAALPPAPNPGKLVGVQIATGPSVDSLRLSWTLLNERHGDSFRSLEPRYTTSTSGSEQTFDLVVGPLANADAARKLCQELALKATPCTVSRFTGDAL